MEQFKANILSIYDKRGEEWLKSLSSTIDLISSSFGLTELRPVSHLIYNYVATAFCKSAPVILKVSVEDITKEVKALEAFKDHGCAKVIMHGNKWVIIERAIPGLSLKSYFPDKEYESIEIVSKIIRDLHQASIPKSYHFPNIRDWLKCLDKDHIDIDDKLLVKARILRDHLFTRKAQEVLLHGDLHHDNILQVGQGWMVIDPKGVIGEPEYEVAAFIRNPIPGLMDIPQAKDIINDRIIELSKILRFDEERVRHWCFVQGILSMIWAIEDKTSHSYFKRLISILEA